MRVALRMVALNRPNLRVLALEQQEVLALELLLFLLPQEHAHDLMLVKHSSSSSLLSPHHPPPAQIAAPETHHQVLVPRPLQGIVL